MSLNRLFQVLLGLALLFAASPLSAARIGKKPVVPSELPAEIRILEKGIKLTMVAEHPSVMTPTGIDVDAQGSIWVVSSHTHFRPEGYVGPEFDEVVKLDADGTRTVFYNKTVATMDLELGSDGWVYLAERDRVLRVKDTDGDGVGDVQEDVAVLETEADYPHNGLSGITWDNDGNLIFSLGENFWKPWTLTGPDKSLVTGVGEGGVFRCLPDGRKLERIAVGFWNPFGVCVREDGEIFVAENDPGSRPPCRLIHLVEDGDYGYQRLYGRAPFHPFVCWNGELRSTLPMITATGEAPCGIEALGGGLLVPSWGDHRIDFFPLHADGASYRSTRIEIVAGGDHFRPVSIAKAGPGVYYLSDWVFGTYEIHGQGRIWKLEIDAEKANWIQPASIQPPNEAKQLFTQLQKQPRSFKTARLLELASSEDSYLSRAAIMALSKRSGKWTAKSIKALPVKDRISSVLAVKVLRPNDAKLAKALLADPDSAVVFEILRWISDSEIMELKDNVGLMFDLADLDYQLFEASLAAWNRLNGNPRAGIEDKTLLTKRVVDESASPRLRAFALRLLPPNVKRISVPLMKKLLALNDPLLSLECVRSLAAMQTDAARALLVETIKGKDVSVELKTESVLGISGVAELYVELLVRLATEEGGTIQREALRALRMSGVDDEGRKRIDRLKGLDPRTEALRQMVLNPAGQISGRPDWEASDLWKERLDKLVGQGDAAEGRRVFFHPRVALCSSCHRFEGRGRLVGPELTAVHDRNDPHWLLESLMQPNKEVAPQFFSWAIQLKDGTDFTGIMLRKGGSSGKEFYRNLTGGEEGFHKTDIISRVENKLSLMPTGILGGLTDYEIRDLMTFLSTGP
ncbi:c-type cytochrome [Verrucomicrobia bacterium]|nr:c-type cytochrome [Verrucomicrobiota bacterium]